MFPRRRGKKEKRGYKLSTLANFKRKKEGSGERMQKGRNPEHYLRGRRLKKGVYILKDIGEGKGETIIVRLLGEINRSKIL